MAQIDLKRATLKVKDGGSNEIEVTIGEGNLTYTERKTIEYTPDRGVLDEVKEGDEVPMEIRLDFVWEYITSRSSGATPSIEDALKNIGGAAGWASTDADACRPYAVDIEILYQPTPSTCGDQETITLPDFRYEQLDHDLRAGTISCTGRCNATTATAVKAAQ
jgi:hypothetical protein